MEAKNNFTYAEGLVSIIMPAYNSEKYIYSSITSVIQQTYKNFELIIINDCSDDKTLEIIKSINDSRIKIMNNAVNLGVAESRNNGIRKAKGQYLAFLDSDDTWLEDKIRLQLNVLKSNVNALCCHTSFFRVDEFDNIIGQVNSVKLVDYSMMLKGNFIGNLTAIVDRNRVSKSIIQKNIRHEDYLMWLEILADNKKCYSVGLQRVLASYRVHKKSITKNKFMSMAWHWNILFFQLRLGFLSSVFHFILYIYFATKKRN